MIQGQPEHPGNIVAGAAGDDPQGHVQPRQRINAQVHHPVTANHHQCCSSVRTGKALIHLLPEAAVAVGLKLDDVPAGGAEVPGGLVAGTFPPPAMMSEGRGRVHRQDDPACRSG
ncbi:hypothetical protein GCM10010523_07290 [Paenarthrobacter ilicis]